MPVALNPTTAPTVAETPAFQKLQQQVEQATSLLASISNQIVAIEASMKPAQPAQESFEESIADIRRIAGLR